MRCRCCGRASFGDVIDLGEMPLVNNLLNEPSQPCPRWSLKVVFCRGCSLAQLTHAPPPECLFNEYVYFSGQSRTMTEHARRLVDRHVRPGDRVLEIASNDGYLLKPAMERGASVLGIEPAANVAAHAQSAGIPTRREYFCEQMAAHLVSEWGLADVVFANNVLAHVPDPNSIMRGIGIMIGSHGTAHVEVPWIVPMIDSGAFDTIYHEHQCYFSINALRALCRRNALRIVNVEFAEVHGGSLHVQIRLRGDESIADRWCEEERHRGIYEDCFYESLAHRVSDLRSTLNEAMSTFDVVAAYGAAAKGIVLLNAMGFTASRVAWVADVSPHKQGRFIPGTGQKIVAPSALLELKPDAALLLPWNIRDEILECNREYRNAGGRFIVAMPEVSIL